MGVTVKDCIELEAFKNARIAGGGGGLDRRVKSITVLESADNPDTLKNITKSEEMVITSFFSVRDDVRKQCKTVEELAKNGNSALVLFNVDSVLKGVGRELTEAADKTGLPLIVMPEDGGLTYADAISAVMHHLMSDDHFGNKLISNTIFHLLNFERHGSFQAALREAAINNDFQIILLSEDFNPILTIETRYRTTISEAIRLGRQRDVGKSAVYTRIDVNGVLTYWGPVIIAGEKHYMFIVDNEDSYSAGEITKLAEIIELAMGMWKYSPERDVKVEFIKALRRGNESLAYNLRDEARIKGEDILSIFFAKGIEKEPAVREMADFEKAGDIHLMKITEGDETHGMILSEKKGGVDIEAQQRARCISLFNKLKEDKSVRILHITGIDGISGAAEAYRLISETWSFVQHVFPYKRVFTKYELALASNCINIHFQGGYVKKNYTALLEPFREAGESKGKQLLETLEVFVLDAGMNSAKTAGFMGIHTNTVQYRLKRINDVLGVEITGNRVIPGLTIALALKRLERVIN